MILAEVLAVKQDYFKGVERVGGVKQRILKGISNSGLQDWAFMLDEYDGIVDYERVTDEDIDELATYILDEIIKKPTLNEDQQIVLEWLKKEYFQGYGPAIIRTINLLQRENSIDISGSKPITQAYRSLNTAGEALVVKMFADWALEQEEE